MRTRAAVIREPGKPWEIAELELDEPGQGEVLIAFRRRACAIPTSTCGPATAPGGCRWSAGTRARAGPGVTRVAVGDHVVCLEDGEIIRGVILHGE